MKGKLELWMLTLSYCKREFIAIMIYVSGSYPISMLSAVSNLMFQVNEYRVPIKVFMPLLPSEFDAINWLFNYATQFLVIIIGSLFFYTYFPLTLVVINHTCWGIDATILMVRKMKAAVEEKPGKEGEKDKKQDKKQDKQEGDEVGEKQDKKRRLVTVQLKEIIEMTLQVQDWMSDVQNLLRTNFLVEFTVLSFLFCMCIFTVSVNFFASMFILLLMYVVLFQLFVYCFMGTRVTSRIESLAEALYDEDWYLMDVKQQKDLQLILLMVQNMHGYDGVFNAVSLETFQWVIFSLFDAKIFNHKKYFHRSSNFRILCLHFWNRCKKLNVSEIANFQHSLV